MTWKCSKQQWFRVGVVWERERERGISCANLSLLSSLESLIEAFPLSYISMHLSNIGRVGGIILHRRILSNNIKLPRSIFIFICLSQSNHKFGLIRVYLLFVAIQVSSNNTQLLSMLHNHVQHKQTFCIIEYTCYHWVFHMFFSHSNHVRLSFVATYTFFHLY